MDLLERFDPVWLALLIVGGLNWAIIALFDKNVVTAIVGSGTGADIAYVVFGLAALMFVPRLMHDMHVKDRIAHPRGA